jgi:hypothetical protein
LEYKAEMGKRNFPFPPKFHFHSAQKVSEYEKRNFENEKDDAVCLSLLQGGSEYAPTAYSLQFGGQENEDQRDYISNGEEMRTKMVEELF